MHIAIIVKSFPSTSETFILNQIKFLIDNDFDVKIFAFKKKFNKKNHAIIEEYDLLEKCTYYENPKEYFILRVCQALRILFFGKRLNLKLLLRSLNFLNLVKQPLV